MMAEDPEKMVVVVVVLEVDIQEGGREGNYRLAAAAAAALGEVASFLVVVATCVGVMMVVYSPLALQRVLHHHTDHQTLRQQQKAQVRILLPLPRRM